MSEKARTGSGRERGFLLLTMAICMAAVLAAIGIGLDTAMLYIVKAKLTAACDGAALAAARNLSVGRTMAAQAEAAESRARSYYEANLPPRYLGGHRQEPRITVPISSASNVLTVTVRGSMILKPLFMTFAGVQDIRVQASGTASRRDVNLMLVLDRSWSMYDSGSCEPMKEAAIAFVNKFVDGRDRLGLFTFGSNMAVAYAPDKYFKSNSSSLEKQIQKIGCDDNTAITTAYYEAYRELIAQNEPSALNVIVLFTDGIPNGIRANWPVKTLGDTRFSDDDAGTAQTYFPKSPCKVPIIDGIITQKAGFASTGKTTGPFAYKANSVTDHKEKVTSKATNCKSLGDSKSARADVAYIPDHDYYGNSVHGYTAWKPEDFFPSGNYKNRIRVDRPSTLGRASKNTLDNAAQRIRDRVDDADIHVVTYVVGLGSYSASEQPDDVLLARVANDHKLSEIHVHDDLEIDGMYIRAEDTAQMSEAFQRIAAEVLRISR